MRTTEGDEMQMLIFSDNTSGSRPQTRKAWRSEVSCQRKGRPIHQPLL